MTLGERIQQQRRKHGLSLSALARASGVSRGYLHAIEADISSPTNGKLQGIASALNMSTSELLGEPDVSTLAPGRVPVRKVIDIGDGMVMVIMTRDEYEQWRK